MSGTANIVGLAHGTPLPLDRMTVAQSQTNALGHLKASEYVRLFDDAIMVFFPLTGLAGTDLRHGGTSPFLMDLHVCYLSEVRAGEAVEIAARFIERDVRRARLMLTMNASADGRRCATCELLLINMDIGLRKPMAWSAHQCTIWDQLAIAHQSLASLPQAGRAISAL
jgi:acyl-CoA thioester hydrolase